MPLKGNAPIASGLSATRKLARNGVVGSESFSSNTQRDLTALQSRVG